MGWLDYHLHEFRVSNPETQRVERIGIPDEDGFEEDMDVKAGWNTLVTDFFRTPGDHAEYTYDFGDGWEHDVLLERVDARDPKEQLPQCQGGAGACPPEDCGGVPGYEDMLAALRDPEHEEHAETLSWVGGHYDPAAFDPARVHFANPEERWRIAFEDEAAPPETSSSESAPRHGSGGRTGKSGPSFLESGSLAADVQRLEAFLHSPDRADDGMSLPQARGFLFGIAAAPAVLPPSQWLGVILGDEHAFASRDEANDVVGSLFRYYDHILTTTALDDFDPAAIGLDIDDDYDLQQWAFGFMQASLVTQDDWEAALELADEETLEYYETSMAALLVWADEEATRKALGDEAYERFLPVARCSIGTALGNLSGIGHDLHNEILTRAHKPIRRAEEPGRNDPCPCGSGRKYKKCCMVGQCFAASDSQEPPSA
jgi:yecA family protein